MANCLHREAHNTTTIAAEIRAACESAAIAIVAVVSIAALAIDARGDWLRAVGAARCKKSTYFACALTLIHYR